MRITLELTLEEEAHLQAQAARRGLRPETLVRLLFRQGLDLENAALETAAMETERAGLMLDETLADFISCVDSRTMISPVPDKADSFTDILVEKAIQQGLTF